ncbi:XRE family transcriptional regulator [Idiomarina sp. Sol25]|uniref:helix-turn-helix domain-containing protein n=1 Tax=Idiomarina sp. Sol25 TaxID=3064000 RepID=UPI00294B6288|nr:XRE family transcriptional regulator [Idiomarina sp. Sol25]MDV6327726.1 XRE family transcriptional regulator [Idiomarina sp. Sol25]
MTDKDKTAINEAIAKRVYTFRKQYGMSLDELAKNAEISKGMLVQIEKGRANPSIGILCKLANALAVSVADIVAVSDDPKVTIRQPQDIPTLWNGEHGGAARLLAGSKGTIMIELWRWSMFPKEQFVSEAHSKGTIELIHVEGGCLDVLVNGETYTLSAGDSMTAEMDVAHTYQNSTNEPVHFTMTVYEKSR